MPPNTLLSRTIDRLLAGEDLGREGAAAALEEIMEGQAEEVQTGAFLVALRAKGETADELAGLAETIRRRSRGVAAPGMALVDTCGTGGGRATFNISTAAAFVVAGAGVSVAKHGNRSATSKCGSADVLEALGARIDLEPDAVARCLEETGVGFMFAPAHHPAFRHVVPVRRALGVRTIFNLLGPLTNPAGARRQLLGVSDPAYMERMARALGALGAEHALLVSSRDGLDELSTGALTDVIELAAGRVRSWQVDPAELGFQAPRDEDLAGGEPDQNAAVLRAIYSGDGGSAAEVTVLNAAAAIWVAGAAESLADALPKARASLREGAARERLEAFVGVTQRLGAREH